MKAFTLAEMLLIMVLLTVMTAVSLPNLSKTYTRIQLQNTANHLSYTMRYAQSRAITQNRPIRLAFEESTRKYRLFENVPDASEEKFQQLTGRWGKLIVIPREIIVALKKRSIDFYPTGEIEKTDIQMCLAKDCMVITTRQQRGSIEVFDKNDYESL